MNKRKNRGATITAVINLIIVLLYVFVRLDQQLDLVGKFVKKLQTNKEKGE